MDDALRKKLAALSALARDRSATEAEGLAAARKMAELLEEHGLSADDIEFVEVRSKLRTRRPTVRTPLIGCIAICTNSPALLVDEPEPGVVFFGKQPGPEIASYLNEVCDRLVDRAVNDFKASAEYRRRRTTGTRRAAVQDFTAGIVDRLSRRLLDMFAEAIDHEEHARAKRAREARLGPVRTVTMPSHVVRFGNAALAGDVAGRSAHLATGVNGARPRRLLT